MRKELPYGTQTDKRFITEAEMWCREQWGPRREITGNREGSWCVFLKGRDAPTQYQWWFATEEQRLLFMLRWV